jgi:hypothetical protein
MRFLKKGGDSPIRVRQSRFALVFLWLFVFPSFLLSQGIVIDHNCADNSEIPAYWINQVKAIIKLHYAHTSHGGQLTKGIERLADSSLLVYDSRLTYSLQKNTLPDSSDLCILDGQLRETYITPELYWKDGGDFYTEETLNAYLPLNVSMWSWCRQMNYYTEEEVESYLNTISRLEEEFPEVVFVYMTGNAQTTGDAGYNRYLRNEQIREYCRENDKILFDFADLDAWYNGEQSTYSYNGMEIPIEHPMYNGDECRHTTFASCENKGRALWWLLAKIGGWGNEECDMNLDGFLEQSDIDAKQEMLLLEYDRWIDECWETGLECGDYNGDGRVDSADLSDKLDSIDLELADWMKDCGFRKKGTNKR